MRKLSQLHVDVSAYMFSLLLTLLFCFFLTAMCYVELCARDTLLSSQGLLLGFFDAITAWADGVIG